MRLMSWIFVAGMAIIVGCSGASFSQADLDRAPLGEKLPPGFLLGTATSAHQIEGGNVNDWTDWEAGSFDDGEPHIHNHEQSGSASESYTHFFEDLDLMRGLGVNTYRFSVEWSRLEPERGTWRSDVIQVYRDWATQLRASGIEPMVTLYHFTLPRWVAAQGGWENPDTVQSFEEFTRRVARELGDQVDIWCTINEPNVVAVHGYLNGIWPPGVKSRPRMARVLVRLLEAHARAAQALRLEDIQDADGDGRATWIGLAHHVRVFQPATSSTLDATIAGVTDAFFNQTIPEAMKSGSVVVSIPGEDEISESIPGLAGATDFLGLNYYTRDHVRADLSDPSFSNQYVPRGRPRNSLGWEIYPEGLLWMLRRYSHQGWPLYVTENGMADSDGTGRAGFLRAHVYAIEQAIEEGVDVRGYYHWSLLDNFEWAEGFEPRFGLYAVDFSSVGKIRTPTAAVEEFRNISSRMGRSK